MLRRAVDPEGNDNLVKERYFGQRHAGSAQIGTRMKHKLIPSGGEIIAFQKRGIHPPVLIGLDLTQFHPRIALAPEQHNAEPGGRAAGGGVQNMRRQAAHRSPPISQLRPTLAGAPERGMVAPFGNPPEFMAITPEDCQLIIVKANKSDQACRLFITWRKAADRWQRPASPPRQTA